jgi:hypothetical protein
MFPFYETELFFLRLIHKYTYEFGKSDVSRVEVFAQFPNTFLINALPHLPPSIPFSGFRLPHLCRNLISIAGMARDSRGRFYKEEAP